MSKLKQILTKISFALILCIMFSSIGIYTSAFSGLLDSYSGSCGLGGIDAVDTFYNDDGTFYAPAGKYKLRFYANDTREYIRFYFDGEVYDTN